LNVKLLASMSQRQRIQLVSIPFLAALLLYVLMPASTVEPPAALATAAPPVADQKAAAESRPVLPEPIPPLPALLVANPFESRPGARSTTDAPIQPTADSTRARQATAFDKVRVTAIVQSASGPAAMVGDRLVRIGDTLENGLRVIHIDATGVELSTAAAAFETVDRQGK
jgi:hypothetical protein